MEASRQAPAPPGWYEDPTEGRERYWTGSRWVDRPRGIANRLAVTAFICAFIPATAIQAIVLGFVALDEIQDVGGRGAGLAKWAIGIGFLTVLATTVGMIFLLSEGSTG